MGLSDTHERRDEFGHVVRVFNELGAALTLTVRQYTNASKLATLSLIGQRLVRRTKLAADHLGSTIMLLDVARQHRQPVPDAAIRNLQFTVRDLQDLQDEFDAQFMQQRRMSMEPVTAPDRER